MRYKNFNEAEFLKSINTWLFVLLFLMVAGFFTWSENIIITRVIKVVGRMGVLIGSYLIYRRIVNNGAPDTLVAKNVLASRLYFAYLGL